MNKIMTILGISVAFLGLYRLIVLLKKEKSIATADIFLGIILFLFMGEAVDKLTINWLFNRVGEVVYHRIIGLMLDCLLVGLLFSSRRRTVRRAFSPMKTACPTPRPSRRRNVTARPCRRVPAGTTPSKRRSWRSTPTSATAGSPYDYFIPLTGFCGKI